MENQILTGRQALQKINRIAHEIYEQNVDETSIIFAGVEGMGYVFAEMLMAAFQEISPIPCQLIRVDLDKTAPLQSKISLDVEDAVLLGKVIILVDDVLNTGRTAAYSLKPFLNNEIKKLQTAFMVDRGHKSFPVSADFVGYSLSTTIQEHITVILDDEEQLGVYLH